MVSLKKWYLTFVLKVAFKPYLCLTCPSSSSNIISKSTFSMVACRKISCILPCVLIYPSWSVIVGKPISSLNTHIGIVIYFSSIFILTLFYEWILTETISTLKKLTHCQWIDGSFTISLVNESLPLLSLQEYLKI